MNVTNTRRAPESGRIGFTTGVQVALAVWLLLSPYFVEYQVSAVLWNNVIVGAMILVLTFVRVASPAAPVPLMINLLLGLWLIAAPFWFDYLQTASFWNSIIVGAIVAVFASLTYRTGRSRRT